MNSFEPVIDKIDWKKSEDGLVPAIVQHAGSGTVLMLAWMNRESLQLTLQQGQVAFFSRSRNTLWTKGETSGNFLEFVSVSVDCDGDTLLVLARPTGPVCHLETETCFGNQEPVALAFINRLQSTIEGRRRADPAVSYTAQLLSGPIHRAAQKVGEEAVETILAATSRDDDSMIDEAADLIYHLMVLLASRNLSIDSVVRRLAERHTKK